MAPPAPPLDSTAERTSWSAAVIVAPDADPTTRADAAPPLVVPRLRRAMAWLGPDFGLVAAFTAALAVLVLAYGGSYKWQEGPILISAGIALALVATRFVWRARSIVMNRPGARAEFHGATVRILRDWGPVILIMWLFQSLETYTGVIRQTSIDPYLYRADVWLFGVEPTVWLSKHSTPLLTDYMALAYGCYFIVPMTLATMLSLRGRREDFREMMTAVVLQMGIGFFLFLIFPAGPPRYYDSLVHGGFDPPVLHSYFGLFELQQGAFDSADPVRTRSAFPSLHCSLALLTLIYSYRFSEAVFPRRPRLWFRIVLVFVVSLWVSVVYLRHHWFVDIFAGLALGATANWLAPILRRRWPKLGHVS
jgi:membrane-associated phospholipid phosphatase